MENKRHYALKLLDVILMKHNEALIENKPD